MDRKTKLLSKLNIKDYTNQLEKLLEKKSFSVDTKNLLLSMFYKIGNAYHDYEKTKIEVSTKSEYFDRVLNLIEINCNELIVAKFNSEESKILKDKNVKSIVDKENKNITVYGNELLVLKSILSLEIKDITVLEEQQILKFALSNFFSIR